MGIVIKGINKPKSCRECPLTYLDTGDDYYFGRNERRCVLDNSIISENGLYDDCQIVSEVPDD